MKIPIRFKLLGRTINVVYEPDLVKKDDITGQARYRFNEIAIQESLEGYRRTDEQIQQTFLHELMHFILYHAGAAYTGKKDYIHQEEEFVDLCAGLLHQALTTAEYDT